MYSKYEVEINAIVQLHAEDPEKALEVLRQRLKMWLDAKSIITTAPKLIKKGDN